MRSITWRYWSSLLSLRRCRKGGLPITTLGDRNGKVVRTFGLLDIIIHLAYSAMFLVDIKRVGEAVRVTCR